jgi:hypothetical protein
MQRKELKPKKCALCGERFIPFSSLAKVCSMACSLDYVGAQAKKQQDKAAKAQKKEFLDNDKSFQRAKAQKSFNEFIRLRDAGLGCVSCDKTIDWHGQWHAGHYKTIGARPDLRFNESNVHKQCSQCNNFLSGNVAMYRIELIKRIGEDRVLEIEKDAGNPMKYTASDYKAIHTQYTKKVKELRARLETTTN